MSTLISIATGNFTAAGTWALADPTSELDSDTSTTGTTTGFVGSSNFTPGAITVDAVAVKLSSRSASPTGTFTVELYNSTGAASVAQVAVNVSDLPLAGGWVVFPIGSTLLLAATNYQVRVKSSTSAQVNVYRNSTSGNWSRQLRTTTTQAPVAGDKLIVAGEHTGAGTGNDFTVTMNETATTIYGSVSFIQSITVSKRSILQYGTTAATNYYLKVAGILKVFSDGLFTIGTSGTPMPSTSTAVLEFSSTVAGDSGLVNGDGGTINTYGAVVTDRAYLAADAAVAATTVTTDVSTGWLSGDEIAFAPTERTIAQFEKRTLSANAVGTSVSVTAGLTYAHDGTSVYAKGEVILLTRNVKIRSASSTLVGYSSYSSTSVTNYQYTEFSKMGTATSTATALSVSVTTGSLIAENCSFYDMTVTNAPTFRFIVAGVANVTVSDCVFYNIYIGLYYSLLNTTPVTSLIHDNNWFIGGTNGIFLVNPSPIISNCRASGMSSIALYGAPTSGTTPLGGFTNCVAHASNTGFQLSSASNGTCSNITAFRNTSFGLEMTDCVNITISTATIRGNTTGNMRITRAINCLLNSFTVVSETTYTTPYGFYIAGDNPGTIIYNSSYGGSAAEDHTAADLLPSGQLSSVIFHKTTFSSATEYGLSINKPGASYNSQDHQTTTGNHKIVAYEGTITRDTVIFNSASPSMRMAPAVSFLKLNSPVFSTAVGSGNTVTVSVNVRKSVVGDGTAYNGAQPRLIVKANPAAGILADTVLDTMSVSAGSWEVLSGVTAAVTEDCRLEFCVDCDGTTGWVNVDDVTLLSEQTNAYKYWADGKPYVVGSPASSGSGSAFTFVS